MSEWVVAGMTGDAGDLEDLLPLSTFACRDMTFSVVPLFAAWRAVRSGEAGPEGVVRAAGCVVLAL